MKTTLATLLLFSLLSLGCGSGNNSNAKSNPLQAVSNGATLATATSYWGCEDCVPGFLLGVEFTSDGAYQTIITGSGPGSTTCTGTVVSQNLSTVALTGSCTDSGGAIKSMTGISGSTASGSFTAGSTTVSMNSGASYPNCVFTLVQGKQGAVR